MNTIGLPRVAGSQQIFADSPGHYGVADLDPAPLQAFHQACGLGIFQQGVMLDTAGATRRRSQSYWRPLKSVMPVSLLGI